MPMGSYLLLIFIFFSQPSGAQTEKNLPVESGDTPELQRDFQSADGKGVPLIAHLLRQNSEEKQIEGLRLSSLQAPLVFVAKGSEMRPMIQLSGFFTNPDSNLFAQGTLVHVAPSGRFSIYAYLKSKVNEITMTAKSSDGKKQTEIIYIYAPDAQTLAARDPWDGPGVSLGLANFIYTQTQFGRFTSITGELGLKYEKSKIWGAFGFSTEGTLTLLTLTSSPISGGPQLLQFQLDASWSAPHKEAAKWTWELLAGLQYLTVFTNGSPFGFSDLLSPTFGFVGRRASGKDFAWRIATHYSPLASPFDFQNRGFDLTLGPSWLLKSNRRFDLLFGYSDILFQPDSVTQVESILLSIKTALNW